MNEGLELRHASVKYGEATAVDSVSLRIPEGRVMALLGPSGCGKSSLLRAIAGLEPMAGGSISWNGEDLGRIPVHRRGVGLMFQDGQLFPHRNVERNVEYGLQAAGVSRASRREQARELLGAVGLEGYGKRSVATLSGGEQQRVALARALAPRPRVLALDEPLSALDRGTRDRLAGQIRSVLRERGTTAIFVTHDQDEAFAIADEVAVMFAGQIVQLGSPEQVWKRPASEDVARFLGYRWFLDARVTSEGIDTLVGSMAGVFGPGGPADGLRDAGRSTTPSEPGVEVGATARLALLSGALLMPPAWADERRCSSDPGIFTRDGRLVRVRIDGFGEIDGVERPGLAAPALDWRRTAIIGRR